MRVLGKGLAELIGEQSENSISEVAVAAIVPNRRQPRTHFKEEAVEELASSIRSVGILQPLVVRPISDGRYELIAGERRLRASKLAGLDTVPVLIRAADDRSSLEMAIIENVQREDISPLESARAYRKLMDEFGLTQEQVADKVGKSRVSIANTVRLLKLPLRVLQALEQGFISEAHARALLGLPSEPEQISALDQIIAKGLTVKEVEKMATRALGARARRPRTVVDHTDPNWRALRDRLAELLGAPVRLEGSERGGRIVIDFYSEDDLVRIAEGLGASL